MDGKREAGRGRGRERERARARARERGRASERESSHSPAEEMRVRVRQAPSFRAAATAAVRDISHISAYLSRHVSSVCS